MTVTSFLFLGFLIAFGIFVADLGNLGIRALLGYFINKRVQKLYKKQLDAQREHLLSQLPIPGYSGAEAN